MLLAAANSLPRLPPQIRKRPAGHQLGKATTGPSKNPKAVRMIQKRLLPTGAVTQKPRAPDQPGPIATTLAPVRRRIRAKGWGNPLAFPNPAVPLNHAAPAADPPRKKLEEEILGEAEEILKAAACLPNASSFLPRVLPIRPLVHPLSSVVSPSSSTSSSSSPYSTLLPPPAIEPPLKAAHAESLAPAGGRKRKADHKAATVHETWWDTPFGNPRISEAKKGNIRMYITACVPEFPGKHKLICELTQKKTPRYKEIVLELFEKAKAEGATKTGILKDLKAALA